MNANTHQELMPHVRLQFHLQNPDYEEVWLEGYEEGIANVDESENPYAQGTKEFEFWSDGWWAAAYGEGPLFNLDGQAYPLEAQQKSQHEMLTEQPLDAEPPTRLEKIGHITIGLLFTSLLAVLLYNLAA